MAKSTSMSGWSAAWLGVTLISWMACFVLWVSDRFGHWWSGLVAFGVQALVLAVLQAVGDRNQSTPDRPDTWEGDR